MSRRRQVTVALLGACLGLGSGCIVGGLGKRAVDQTPLRIVDVVSGRPITYCLVIPVYDRAAGVGTMAGEGPGASVVEYKFVANPFIYRTGDPFKPIERGGGGIGLPFGIAGAGNGWGIDGVVVVAKGFNPMYIYKLWDRAERPELRFTLAPVSAAEWTAYAARLTQAISAKTPKKGELASLLGLYDSDGFRAQFTESDRRLLTTFLSR